MAKKVKKSAIKVRKVARASKKVRARMAEQAQQDILIRKGQERGFVTTAEILQAFPNVERDIEGVEALYDELKQKNIQIREMREFLETKKQKEKKPKKPLTIGKIDSIQMYLKEIGKT